MEKPALRAFCFWDAWKMLASHARPASNEYVFELQQTSSPRSLLNTVVRPESSGPCVRVPYYFRDFSTFRTRPSRVRSGIRSVNDREFRGNLTMKRQPSDRRHGFLHDLKWIIILWCVGVGATAILVLPFHLLVAQMMRK